MAKDDLIQVRVDSNLKESADALFSHLGLDTPTAIRMFLRQSVMRDGIPFEVSCVPNAETAAALRETTGKRYASFAEVLADAQIQP